MKYFIYKYLVKLWHNYHWRIVLKIIASDYFYKEWCRYYGQSTKSPSVTEYPEGETRNRSDMVDAMAYGMKTIYTPPKQIPPSI